MELGGRIREMKESRSKKDGFIISPKIGDDDADL